MAKTKTSSTVKQRYNEKAYDRLAITIPKGAKKELEKAAQEKGTSVNGYVNDAIAAKIGVNSLKIFSVRITERQSIIDASTMQSMDDAGLYALDGIRQKTVTVKALSPQEAIHQAADEYNQTPPDDFNPGSITFEMEEPEDKE